MRFCVALVLIFFASWGAVADDSALLSNSGNSGNSGNPGDWGPWSEARALFDAGKYDEAIQSLKKSPRETPNYYYDLGTLYLKANQSGPAVAYLEKADRLRSHDASIRHNLRIAKSQLASKLGGEERLDPASLWTESLADQVPIEEVRGALGLVGLILIGLWLNSYRKSHNILKALSQPASLLVLAAFLLTAGLYVAERNAASHPPAIVLESETVRSGPGAQFAEVAHLESGTKLRLLGPEANSDKSELWRQVRFGADDIGWVPAASMLLL